MEPTLDEAEDIFRRSLNNFQKQLDSDQREAFEVTSLADLKREILSMQREQEQLRRLQDPSRLAPFIGAFEEFHQVCQAVTIRVAGIAAFTWGPLKWVLHRAKEDDKVLDAIFDKCFKLGRHVPLLEPYCAALKEAAPMKRCLAFMYEDLLEFYASILKLFSQKNWKQTFQAGMLDYATCFEKLLERFSSQSRHLRKLFENHQRKLSQTANRQMNNQSQQLQDHIVNAASHYDDVQARIQQLLQDRETLFRDVREKEKKRKEDIYDDVEARIQQYQRDRETLLRDVKEEEKKRKEDMYAAVIDWISAPWDLQRKYHFQWVDLQRQFPGTGQRILGTDKLEEWMYLDTPPQSLLWMNGKMGAGKTVLASQIIEKCQEIEGFVTSYFYCRGENATQNTTLAFYQCLLRQLISHHRDLLPSCNEKRKRGERLLNDTLTAKSLIELFCDVQLNQFIIVDGLDECEVEVERRTILQFLRNIVDRCDTYKPGKIRVLLVSRDLPGIRKHLQSSAILDLRPSDTDKDIEVFMATKMQELEDKFPLSDEDANMVKLTICARADGMFLFASLVVEDLLRQPNIRSMMREINEDKLPKSLEEAYNKILDRLRRNLSQNQWEEARKIFGWLACAKRPLKLHELQAARVLQLTGEYNEQQMDFYYWGLRGDIRDICGSLVHQLPRTRFEFTHSTTRRHIITSQNLDERALELDLTVTCLNYLSLDCFRGNLNDDDRRRYAKDGYYAFQDYAISKWAHHVETLIKNGPSLYDDTETGLKCRRRLSQALSKFIELYRPGLLAEPERPKGTGSSHEQQQCNPSDDPAVFCAAFSNQQTLYNDLLLVWSHIYKHKQADLKSRNKVSIKELSESFSKIREVLETLKPAQSARLSGAPGPIIELYGSNFVKCDHLTCDYFYEGFETRSELQKHLARHDRPFSCPVKGCNMVKFGFSSNKDRDRHMQQYHPDELARFVQINQPVIEETGHRCDLCGKKFMRAANLRAHKDNHFGIRRFECSTCGRAFTRANDRTRHQNTVHATRRRGRRKVMQT